MRLREGGRREERKGEGGGKRRGGGNDDKVREEERGFRREERDFSLVDLLRQLKTFNVIQYASIAKHYTTLSSTYLTEGREEPHVPHSAPLLT